MQCFYHIESSQLIWRVNQLAGFYMMRKLLVHVVNNDGRNAPHTSLGTAKDFVKGYKTLMESLKISTSSQVSKRYRFRLYLRNSWDIIRVKGRINKIVDWKQTMNFNADVFDSCFESIYGCFCFRAPKEMLKRVFVLTFSCIMLKNGQTYFKNLAEFTRQDF